MRLSFVIPSRPGADLSAIKREVSRLDLAGHAAEFFFVEGTLPPMQRNVAIRRSTGAFVFLLDDDLVLPANLVARTLEQFDADEVAVVGGPNLTPEDDPVFAQLSGEVLASPLATGATSCRWRAGSADYDASEGQLHGCFLCFRGDLLRRYLFVETLFPNDENELMGRLRRDGYRLYYVPECSVEHRRRATLRSHLRQVHISGRGRGELIRRSGLDGQWTYLAPLGLVVYLALAPALLSQSLAFAAPLALYGTLAMAMSAFVWRRRRRAFFLWAGPLMAASHVVYAAGLVAGLLSRGRRSGSATTVEVVESDLSEAVPKQ
jgi:GT2 family glycosyltransferase